MQVYQAAARQARATLALALTRGRAAARWLGFALLPPHCLACGEAGVAGRDLCAACHAELPWQVASCLQCGLSLAADRPQCGSCEFDPPPYYRTVVAFGYRFPLDRLLPRVKFHGDLAAARLVSGLACEAFAGAPRPDVVVPVPLHWRRLRARGFDQARELARPIARQLDLPLATRLLRRRRPTRPQSTLDADARAGNLLEAFEYVGRGRPPAHVALFDDVVTTGATMRAAAWTLRQAGVRRVDAWCCARA